MFKKLLVTTILLSGLAAHAGQDGNGGFAVQCPGKPLRMLDIYEMSFPEGKSPYHLDLGAPNLDVESKVQIMLKRLEKLSKATADKYRQIYADYDKVSLVSDATVYHGNEIIIGDQVASTIDVGDTVLEQGCKLVPVARNISSGPIRIHYKKKIYSQLNNDNKAIAKMHETLYLNSGEKNSENTRKVVRLLASREIETMTLEQVIKAFAEAKGPRGATVNVNSDEIPLHRIFADTIQMSDDNSFIKSIGVENPNLWPSTRKFNFLGHELMILSVAKDPNSYYYKLEYINKDTPKTFYFNTDSKNPKSINYNFNQGHLVFSEKEDSYAANILIANDLNIISLYGKDDIQSLTATVSELQFQNILVTSNQVLSVEFYPGKKLKSVTLKYGNSYFTVTQDDGTKSALKKIVFDEKGNLVGAVAQLVDVSEVIGFPYSTATRKYTLSSFSKTGDVIHANLARNEFLAAPVNYLHSRKVFFYNEKVVLDGQGHIRCAKLAGEDGSIELNGKNVKAGYPKTYQFDENERAIGVGTCSVD